ncbi:MAG: ATP-binding protein, partial [Myxococcota bacterium]|nr:ATP-binding protein [Myxococcota bacterium]
MLSPAELGPAMPALIDALGFGGTAVLVIADQGAGLENWYANEAAAALIGYPLEVLDTIPTLEMIVPEQRALVTQLTSSIRAGQPVPPALELIGLRQDGSRIVVEVTMGHYRIPDGVVYVMVVRDLSANQPSQLSLLEADRIGLVGALSAGFAHEINNPLTSVLLNLRSLRKQLAANLPEEAQAQALRCLDDIAIGAERIASNVRALQTLAARSETKGIDLATVVSSALRLAAPTLEPRALVVRQIVPVRPVIGEEARVGQAVLAMMLFSSSGFDAATASTTNRITVVVEERHGSVVVEVSDNGRELTPEEARRAFDPFFRSSARGAGVGVGLGVARSVAATLGGEVTL